MPAQSQAFPAKAACKDETFQIYFKQGSAAVTAAAQRTLAAHHRHWMTCEVRAISLEGGRDLVGAAADDEALAGRRTESVATALEAMGVSHRAISTTPMASKPGVKVLRRRVVATVSLAQK